MPFTCCLIDKAVGRLRAVGAKGADAKAEINLWRGLKNVQIRDVFMMDGGTELAPMSTTTDVKVAIQYSMSDNCILFKLLTKSSMERGADLAFLSAFPGESEVLFKPLTYLQPIGAPKKITLAGKPITVIDVEPRT